MGIYPERGVILPERSVTVVIRATDSYSATLAEYGRKMDSAAGKTRDMGNAAGEAQPKTNLLRDAAKGFIGALAVGTIISAADETLRLGQEINKTKDRFTELVTPLGDAETIMQRLRDASMGGATDSDLMEGSNLLMMTGVADSPEELETIIDLITRTKKPTEDLSSAIENFSLMMSNQSVMRLDSFGLSSGRVRQRILELMESGQALSREQAFKMAVLEEGSRLIDRLGDSADSSVSAIDRLGVRWDNAMNTIQSTAAETVEAAATSLDQLGQIISIGLGTHPEQQRQNEEAADQLAADYAMAVAEAMKDPAIAAFMANADPAIMEAYIKNMISAVQNDPSIAGSIGALRNTGLSGALNANVTDATFAPGSGNEGDLPALNALATITASAATRQQQQRESLAIQTQQADEAQRLADIQAEHEYNQRRLNDLWTSGLDAVTMMADRVYELGAQSTSFMSELDALSLASQDLDFGEFATPEQAEHARALAEHAQHIADQMKEIDAADEFAFSDEQIASADALAERLDKAADNAEIAKEKLDNLSLSSFFGQTGGGITGEVGDAVIERMRANGATDEQIAAFQREMDMTSGRQTSGGAAFTENLVPQIAALADDPELMAELAGAIGTVFTRAAEMGLDPNSPEFINQLGKDITAEGEGFDPDAFLTNFQELSTQADLFKTSINTFFTDITAAQDPTAAVEGSMGNISTFADNIAARFRDLTSKVQKVRVEITTTVSGDGASFIEDVVRSQGGHVPGMVRD